MIANLLFRAARELSSGRRAAVVVLSLAFFLAVAFYTGRKYRRALAERDRAPDRYPDEMP